MLIEKSKGTPIFINNKYFHFEVDLKWIELNVIK